MTVEEKLVTNKGLGITVGRCLGLFYAANGMVGSWYPEWLKVALNVLIGLFCRYRLAENVAKSKAMTFHPGTLWYKMF